MRHVQIRVLLLVLAPCAVGCFDAGLALKGNKGLPDSGSRAVAAVKDSGAAESARKDPGSAPTANAGILAGNKEVASAGSPGSPSAFGSDPGASSGSDAGTSSQGANPGASSPGGNVPGASGSNASGDPGAGTSPGSSNPGAGTSDPTANGSANGDNTAADKNQVSVPNVVGDTLQDALRKLREARLKASLSQETLKKLADRRKNQQRKAQQDSGVTVASQQPDASSSPVAQGTKVQLELQFKDDSQADRVTVPDVKGQALAQARQALQAAGLKVVAQGQGGTVQSQEPAAGSSVRKGAAVALRLTTSGPNGPNDLLRAQRKVSVPNLTGLTLAQAQQALQAAGLAWQVSGTGTGRVRNQWPQAGTQVNRGSAVSVTLQPPAPSSNRPAANQLPGRNSQRLSGR
jgi:beta-lactam-binding protein with PASTA domain